MTLWQYLNFCPVSHFGTPQWLLDRQKNLPTCHCHYCCRILFCKIYQRPRLAGNLILLDTQKSSWTPLTFHNTQLKSLLQMQKKDIWKGHFCWNILSICAWLLVYVSPFYIVTSFLPMTAVLYITFYKYVMRTNTRE